MQATVESGVKSFQRRPQNGKNGHTFCYGKVLAIFLRLGVKPWVQL
jgi:hypothetical protein